jgi:hypothetical protein
MSDTHVRRLKGLSNLEFLKRYAKPGCIGLMGGSSAIDRAIRQGQRGIDGEAKSSLWSHAVIFQGERVDGEPWLIESDFEVGKGSVRNGVQENRVDKYASEKDWPNLAVLDFGFKEREAQRVVGACLELVARRTNYDLSGILETYWAMMRRTMSRGREKESRFCSAFVRAVYKHAGLDLAPGIAIQHTLPEQVSRTTLPHIRYLLVRDES